MTRLKRRSVDVEENVVEQLRANEAVLVGAGNVKVEILNLGDVYKVEIKTEIKKCQSLLSDCPWSNLIYLFSFFRSSPLRDFILKKVFYVLNTHEHIKHFYDYYFIFFNNSNYKIFNNYS